MKGGEQGTEWNAGGDFGIGISTTSSQLICSSKLLATTSRGH